MVATNKNIHLDYSYFLLRREPNVLVRLLSEPHNNNSNNNDDDSGWGGGDGGVDDHDNEGYDVDD